MLHRLKNETGSVLMGAIIVMLVAAIISAMLAANLMAAIRVTGSTEDNVRAQLNSDTAVDAAYLKYNGNPCDDSWYKGKSGPHLTETPEESNKGIFYDVNVTRSGGDTCYNSTLLTVQAIGYSKEDMKVKFTQNVVYALVSGEPVTPPTTGESFTRGILSGTTVQANALRVGAGGVSLRTGNFSCTSGTTVPGDVIVFQGTATVGSGCTISGNLYASGLVAVSGTVQGNIVSLADGNNTFSGATVGGTTSLNGWFTATGSTFQNNLTAASSTRGTGSSADGTTRIQGTLWTNEILTLVGATSSGAATNVTGNVWVYTSSSTRESTIGRYAVIGGDLLIAGRNSQSTPLRTSGSYEIRSRTVTEAPTAAFPSSVDATSSDNRWVDYNYDAATWAKSSWTNVVTLASNQCDMRVAANVARIGNTGGPTLVDARNCTAANGFITTGLTLNLQQDITLLLSPAVASASAMTGTVFNSPTAGRVFNILVPDASVDGSPSCVPASNALNLSGVVMNSNVTGMLYTPCAVRFDGNGAKWNGKMYVGGGVTSSNSGSAISDITGQDTPDQRRLPGFYTNGAPTATPAPPAPKYIGGIVSRRNG